MLPSGGYLRELNTFWILQEFDWKSAIVNEKRVSFWKHAGHGKKKKREYAT
jgi:hypothetical protein